jgi:hypothetical protein
MRNPVAMKTMERVMQINPQYSAIDYATSKKAQSDFSVGKTGNIVRSLNVAVDHLDTLGQLADAMNNGNTQAINRVGNFVATQTGNPAPTNFAAAKKIVADEIVKAVVGAGGGVADREEAAKQISTASSPAQLKGVIKTYQKLMAGQLGGLQRQYETNTGRKDFQRFLSETSKKELGISPENDIHSQADAILAGH